MNEEKRFISLDNLSEFKELYDTQLGDNYYNKDEVDSKVVPYQPFPEDFITNETTLVLINSIKAQNYPAGSTFLGGVTLTDMPFNGNAEVEVYIYPNNVVYLTLRSSNVSPYIWECNSHSYRGWEAVGKAYADANFLKKDNTTAYTPSGDYNPSTKKYVDDLFNSDLLHYKGHVSNVEGLPDLGQASGLNISPKLSIGTNSQGWIITPYTDGTSLYGQLQNRGYDFYATIESRKLNYYKSGIGVLTNYPEQVFIQFEHEGDFTSSSPYYTMVFGIKYNPNKPVYITCRKDSSGYDGRIKNVEGTITTITATSTMSEPQLVTEDIIFGLPVTTNTRNYGGAYDIAADLCAALRIATNFPKLKYGSSNIKFSSWSDAPYSTLTLPDGYNYNDGMYLLTNPTGVVTATTYQKNTTSAKENDVYTVGQNYDIYRCNASPAWELWSRGEVSQSDLETTISNIAPAYDNTQTYNTGDYVIYNNQLYVCNTDIQTAEDFDSTKWDTTTVAEILGNIKSLLGGI